MLQKDRHDLGLSVPDVYEEPVVEGRLNPRAVIYLELHATAEFHQFRSRPDFVDQVVIFRVLGVKYTQEVKESIGALRQMKVAEIAVAVMSDILFGAIDVLCIDPLEHVGDPTGHIALDERIGIHVSSSPGSGPKLLLRA